MHVLSYASALAVRWIAFVFICPAEFLSLAELSSSFSVSPLYSVHICQRPLPDHRVGHVTPDQPVSERCAFSNGDWSRCTPLIQARPIKVSPGWINGHWKSISSKTCESRALVTKACSRDQTHTQKDTELKGEERLSSDVTAETPKSSLKVDQPWTCQMHRISFVHLYLG